MIETWINTYSRGIQYRFFGGHFYCERKMLCIYPEYINENDIVFPINAYIIDIRNGMKFDHRQVLGALMGLGLERKCIGDINIFDDIIQIIIQKKFSELLLFQFENIGRYRVKGKMVPCNEIIPFAPKYKILNISVASARLDSVLAKTFGISRNESVKLINKGKVQVDYQEVLKADYKIYYKGTIISVRGYGKARINEFKGETKKKNIKIEIYKYI
jgi:RNA-binding protein YlmH